MDNISIMAHLDYSFDGISIYIKDNLGRCGEIVFSDVEEFSIRPAAGYMRIEEAQQLMDMLWSCRIRPTEGSGSAGSLSATENHLSDMRKIVFDNFLKEEHHGKGD